MASKLLISNPAGLYTQRSSGGSTTLGPSQFEDLFLAGITRSSELFKQRTPSDLGFCNQLKHVIRFFKTMILTVDVVQSCNQHNRRSEA